MMTSVVFHHTWLLSGPYQHVLVPVVYSRNVCPSVQSFIENITLLYGVPRASFLCL